MRIVGPEAAAHLDWTALCDAIEAGHLLPPARISDMVLRRGADTLLVRAAMIDGLGQAVKAATVFPGNPAQGVPAVNGGVMLFADATGLPEAVVDFHLVTRWKTAADSLLAARRLARPDSRRILICGAGTVARSMVEAYRSRWPEAEIAVWNRTPAAAERMAAELGLAVATDLPAAVAEADILCTATMAETPVLRGDWLQPGQHLDLIGAFRADMREVDDTALRRARIFVDSRATTLHHIGELKIPLEAGVIDEADVLGDFRDIATGGFARRSKDEITIAKNGGGAHLDLMTARYILAAAPPP